MWHQNALTKWQAARDPSKAEQKISHGEDEIDAAVDEDPTTGIGYGHVVALLTEVKRAGSAYDWERSMDVLRRCGAALPHGFDGRQVCRQLCTVCAGFEKNVTRCLLQEAALVALQQDGRDPWLLILSRMVLWRLPRSDKEGCLRAVKSVLPCGGPPWTADRFLKAHRFGDDDRTGPAQAGIIIGALRQAAGENGDFQAIADKVGFDTKDNAADEIVCGRSMKAEFKNMIDLGGHDPLDAVDHQARVQG